MPLTASLISSSDNTWPGSSASNANLISFCVRWSKSCLPCRLTFDSELKMKHVFQLDPWAQTLAMLSSCSGLEPSDCDDEYFYQIRCRMSLLSRTSTGKVKWAAGNERDTCATIRILERLSASAVSLSWHDPTSLNYAEQVWRMGGAPKSGRCAVSGERILRGQSVYRPRRSGKDAPLNRSEMILTSVILGACSSSADIPYELMVCRIEND